MKKISYYLIFIVAVGGVLVSFWAYQRYFKKEEPKLLLFKVERGVIQETVRARGEVAAQKEFDLEFPFSGTVEKIFAAEGQQINQGSPLMKLETTDFELEIQKLNAQLAQSEASVKSQQAKLDELKRGTRTEEIEVQKIKAENAKTALENAKKDLVDILQDAYTRSDDAVRNKTDQLFNNPRSSSPQLKFSAIDGQLETDTEWQRILVETTLNSWRSSLDQLTAASDLDYYIAEAKKNLDRIKSFLDGAALAINGATPGSALSQTTIDGWRSDVAAARTNVNTAVNNVSAKEEKLRSAGSTLLLEEKQLVLKEAGTVSEQILAQEAEVEKAQADVLSSRAQIAVAQEKIKKSTLYAPGAAKVVKIWLERQEVFRPGQSAITLETSGYKIQADISELEIGKVRTVDGSEVLVRLDAFPGQEFKGRVVSIEPKEIVKEGDKYYRVNIYFEKQRELVRPGMSADLIINISFKDNVLKIPELAIEQKDGKKFVVVLEGNQSKETEIETGISDGESIEVVKGLEEGQIIAVSAD